jgi:hypothetical protein
LSGFLCDPVPVYPNCKDWWKDLQPHRALLSSYQGSEIHKSRSLHKCIYLPSSILWMWFRFQFVDFLRNISHQQ